MLRVQERNVKDLLRIVAPMITDLLVLEVRVLHISMLLELFYIYFGLCYGGPPAIICQSNAIAKALDGSFEHLKLDVLNLKFPLELAYKFFFVRWLKSKLASWPHVLALLAHVTPTYMIKLDYLSIC